jgi:hypothetical protein
MWRRILQDFEDCRQEDPITWLCLMALLGIAMLMIVILVSHLGAALWELL